MGKAREKGEPAGKDCFRLRFLPEGQTDSSLGNKLASWRRDFLTLCFLGSFGFLVLGSEWLQGFSFSLFFLPRPLVFHL